MQNKGLGLQKPRYEILDGLRGVAAIVIVIYHLFEGCGIVLGHAYLGVDFFYALSGFVIGYAYDDRWKSITIGEFFKRRIVRLHPMVIMGTLLGLLFYYFGKSAAFPFIGETPWWGVILLFFYCCMMLPMPNAWDIRGWQDFNSFNGNIWSLYWEYLANILYAFVFRLLPTAMLTIIAVVAAIGTIDITLNIDIFGIFANERVGTPFGVNGGWSITTAELYIGFVRLLYPFVIGLLISRIGCKMRLKGAFGLCSLFIIILLLFPQLTGIANGIYEAIIILLLIPLIISVAAGSDIHKKNADRLCRFLGEISYPLYITHLPFIYMQIAWVSNNPNASTGTLIMIGVSLFIISLCTAYACMRLYDTPVRKWLGRVWLKKR